LGVFGNGKSRSMSGRIGVPRERGDRVTPLRD
jgi:hypothetical protein